LILSERKEMRRKERFGESKGQGRPTKSDFGPERKESPPFVKGEARGICSS